MPCSGKHHEDAVTGHWARQLDTYLAAIAFWGARAPVCLVEAHEREALAVPGLSAQAREAGFEFHNLRMPVPVSAFECLRVWSIAR